MKLEQPVREIVKGLNRWFGLKRNNIFIVKALQMQKAAPGVPQSWSETLNAASFIVTWLTKIVSV